MDKIIIKGAREHNLKNINVEIPRNKLVVITGLSGSGKSSLAFDTIYAEGHRRYVESLSSYARQFLNIMDKPDVDLIEGLSPAIAIDQRSAAGSPRSTVGTVTEIYDYLRVLYAYAGIPHCFRCSEKLLKQTPQEISSQILSFFKKDSVSKKLFILAPIIKEQKGEHKHLFTQFKKTGFVQARVDSVLIDISETPILDKNKKHHIDLVIGEVVSGKSKEELKKQLTTQVEKALKWGRGVLILYNPIQKKEYVYSELFACPNCGLSLPEITPRLFSFNNPQGACPACTGLGVRLEVDPALVIPNPRLTLAEGAIFPWARSTSKIGWREKILMAVAKKYNFSVDVPVSELSKKAKEIILYGTGDETYEIKDNYGQTQKVKYEGVIADLEQQHKETKSEYVRREMEKYMKVRLCKICKGNRLKPEVLAITISGQSIVEMSKMSIKNMRNFLAKLNIDKSKEKIVEPLIKNILERLDLLIDIGLDYLTLDRASTTLSGGEAQRIRLATQISTKLTGVIYILDEPTIGLHYRDNYRLIKALKKLIEIDNSIIVIEHDRAVIEAADLVIDMGPGAGEAGGQIVAIGTPKEITQNPHSLTGLYLAGKKSISLPKRHRSPNSKKLVIVKAAENNLKDIDVEIPLGLFVCVTGVSGAGKSSLVDEILAKTLQVKYHRAKIDVGKCKEIKGTENLDKVIIIDQSPIGRTPRSNPATYTNIFALIREVFASTPEAKLRHYSLSQFSFNLQGGRCEFCRGDGVIKIEMHFLPDVYVSCPECQGKRYKSETLGIKYKDKNIADILEMTVDKALDFFGDFPLIRAKLKILDDIGLGYLKLGQPANTLSGGEAQRVKLAAELSRKPTGKTLYILDEPTTGLHFEDIKKLLDVLQKLVDKGNSVVITEHNLDVIKCADWVIDLGPEGGDRGGWIVAEGPPEKVAKVKGSYTGWYLKKILT